MMIRGRINYERDYFPRRHVHGEFLWYEVDGKFYCSKTGEPIEVEKMTWDELFEWTVVFPDGTHGMYFDNELRIEKTSAP